MKECVDYTVNNLQYNCKDGILNLRCGEGNFTTMETIIHILEGILVSVDPSCPNFDKRTFRMYKWKSDLLKHAKPEITNVEPKRHRFM